VKIPARHVTQWIDTDDYTFCYGNVWRYGESGNPVTTQSVIDVLNEWRAGKYYPTCGETIKAVAVDKPKRKWEVSFDNGAAPQQVEADLFATDSHQNAVFYDDGNDGPVFFASGRNVQYVKEIK
jgi:hypothetical protein